MGEYREHVTISGDASDYEQALDAAAAKTKQTAGTLSSSLTAAGRRFDAAGRSMMRTGRSLTTWVTLPIVGIGIAATKSALDFDTAFRKIKTLAGDTGMSVAQMKREVKGLAHETAQAPQDLANALYFVASSGLEASKVMPTLRATAMGAAAGMGDTATIAQLLTSVMNDYAKSGMTATKAMNILTGAIKAGKAEPQDLAASLGQVIPTATQLGIGFEDVAAAMAASTNAGTDAARSATGLRFLLTSLGNPTAKAAAVLKDYGISVQSLRDGLAQPGGLLTTLQGLADKFDVSTAKGFAAFQAIIGGARGSVVANSLVGESADTAARAFEDLGAAADANSTIFADAVTKMQKTKGFQLQQALTELKLAMIDLGTNIIPILVNDIIPALKSGFRWFNNLSEGTQSLIVKLGIAAAAGGPLLLFAGALARVAGAALRVVGGLGRVASAVTGISGAGGVGGAGAGLLGFLASPAGAIAVGVLATIGGSLLLNAAYNKRWNEQVDAMIDRFRRLPGAIDAAKTRLDAFNRQRQDEPFSAAQDYARASRGGGMGTPRIVQQTTEALATYRAEIERIVRAQDISDRGLEHWTKSLLKNQSVTGDEARALAGAVRQLDFMGAGLTSTERRMVSNLLKMGDYNRALQILREKIQAVAKKWDARVQVSVQGMNQVLALRTALFNINGSMQGWGQVRHAGGRMHAGGEAGRPLASDEVPAILQRGEFVINRESARRIGYGTLAGLNRMHGGGPVDPAYERLESILQMFRSMGGAGADDILIPKEMRLKIRRLLKKLTDDQLAELKVRVRKGFIVAGADRLFFRPDLFNAATGGNAGNRGRGGGGGGGAGGGGAGGGGVEGGAGRVVIAGFTEKGRDETVDVLAEASRRSARRSAGGVGLADAVNATMLDSALRSGDL